MNAAQAVVHRLPTRHPVPEPVHVASAEARVRTLLARQLPRLEALGQALRHHLRTPDAAPLAAALQAHLDVIAALRFELLVSPGLRAAPRERDEAAFRRHVVQVSECTEASWLAIKRYMEESAATPAQFESLASDYSVELRALQRRSAEESRAAEVLQALCDAARAAPAAAYQLGEAHAVLRGTLKSLAVRLSSGLLERLRVLVAGDVGAPAEELRNAQQARGDLQAALSAALADLARVQSCGQDVAVWLDAAAHQAAALRPDQ